MKIQRSVKAIALLTPLLGLSWIFGIFAVDESTKWFSYIFVVCNSFQVSSSSFEFSCFFQLTLYLGRCRFGRQGLVIFILHCTRNDDVRKAFMKQYKKSFETSSSSFLSTSVAPSSEASFAKLASINSVSGNSLTQ